MKANLDRQIPVSEMAGSVQLSPSHLRQLFKNATGTSLARYLRDLRLKKAKDLLETAFLSVKQVATKVGINDVSHFVRNFKEAYGVTPFQYPARYCRATQKTHIARMTFPDSLIIISANKTLNRLMKFPRFSQNNQLL